MTLYHFTASVPYKNKIILIPPFCPLYHCCYLCCLFICNVAFIVLNKLLAQSRKIKVFILFSLIPFSATLPLWRCKFCTYVTSSCLKNFLTSLARQCTSNKFPQYLFVWESLYLSFLIDNFAGYRILGL